MKSLLLFVLSLSALANDPLSSLQWGLKNSGQPVFRSTGELTREFSRGLNGEDIQIPENLKLSNKKVIVAVIDSGVDISHPDLKDNIWENPKCLDLSEDERKEEDCHGWNFLNGNNDLTDDIGHGTHVAGIIAGVEGNGIGVKGVASKNVEIMPLKILNSKVNSFIYEKRVLTNIIADAIAYAVNNGASVINLSLGWPKLIHTRKVRFALDKAISSNIPVVVASGNNNKKVPVYPCAYPEVICVGAMDNKGNIPEFSNYGGKVDIIAPGEGIVSTYPREMESRLLRIPGYEFKKGSSQAAPFVSGIIALAKSKSELSVDEIKYKLYKNAVNSKGSKTVMYGKASLDSLLNTEVNTDFPSFDFKSLTEVIVKEDGKFQFILPVRALVKDIEKLNFTVSVSNNLGKVFSREFKDLKVLQKKKREVLVRGSLEDFSADSHSKLVIRFSDKVLEHQIAFVREISKIKSKTVIKTDIKAKDLITLKNGRKFSRLRKIVSTNFQDDTVDYFYENIKSTDSTEINIVQITGEEAKASKINISKVNKVLNVVKNDFNFDGKSDYMIYSLGKEKLNLILSFVSKDGEPIFGELSNWTFPISDFEGLPFFNGEIKFEYLKHNSKELGSIKIPSFMKTWKMPEPDNTLDPLDRIIPDAPVKRPYYLLPVVENGKVTVVVRTMSSHKFLTDFREKFDVSHNEELYFDSVINQNIENSSLAKVSTIVVTGREFSKKYFELTYKTPIEYEIKEINLWGRSLESNKTLISSDTNSFERASFALLDRQRLRTQFWNKEEVSDSLEFDTKSWGDLIIDVLSFSTRSAVKALFIESRYHVHLASSTGETFKLPINRESSFPGVNFSETIKPVSITTDSGVNSALLIDSSLIYGDRLYSMVFDGQSFSAPIYGSFKVPSNCKHVDTVITNTQSALLLTCLQRNNTATIELVKLEKRIK